ncbi:MAG: hypothetical protein D6775_09380 [Caldilineae bacterium]|nr:MAG: hypothetical protein D6775_09380 [Caldilineae bacterium]
MLEPRLTFACELETRPLQELFARSDVLSDLQDLGAGVAMGLLDFSAERAEVVRQLNRLGIPLTAWLLLPKEQGYWFNARNAAQARACYEAFKQWTRRYDLRWISLALDIEPDYHELQALLQGRVMPLLWPMLRRAFAREQVLQARLAYGALVRDMHRDGYFVESYQLPLIADERHAGSVFVQGLLGLVDVPVDRETLMLYSSFLRPYGAAVLLAYAGEADVVGVGSTGGGVDPGLAPPLSWEDLARDLRLAYRYSDHIFVFSLEGCVEQGFLPRLLEFEWDAPVELPTDLVERVQQLRRVLRGMLWTTAHPWAVAAGVLAVLLWTRRRRPRGG